MPPTPPHPAPRRRLARASGQPVAALGLLLALAACASGDPSLRERELVRDALPPDVQAALDIVAGLQDAMVGIMKAGPELGYSGRYLAIHAVAHASFDLAGMARVSYGPGFAALDAEQQRVWLDVYERFHISSLADVRERYRGQSYHNIGYREPAPGVVVIETKLEVPGRAVELYIDYRLRRGEQGWRIFDVHDPPSISEVAMRRAEYRTVLDKHGFDGLVAEMEARIRRRERP